MGFKCHSKLAVDRAGGANELYFCCIHNVCNNMAQGLYDTTGCSTIATTVSQFFDTKANNSLNKQH